MTMDRVHEGRDGPLCELTVAATIPPYTGLLHIGRLNFLALQTRVTLARALHARMELDWAGVLEQACFLALRQYREGEPLIDLREVDVGSRPRWLLEPYLEAGGPTILFADGGTGKSMLALAMAMSIATGVSLLGIPRAEPRPVLYLDWEADHYIHAERLNALTMGHGLHIAAPIHYRHQVTSLMEAAPLIRRDVAQLGAGAVIVDSLGAAKGGEPESAAASIGLFTAARSFGVPWIGIDHLVKSANGNATTGHARPFGSTYTHNLARVTWGIEQPDDPAPDGPLAVIFTNHKANNGRLLPRRAFELELESSEDGERLIRVHIKGRDPATIPSLFDRLPLAQRIVALLRHQYLSTEALTLELGETDSRQVKARVSELKQKGTILLAPDGRWGLVSGA